MIQLLASVKDENEAWLAMEAGADIIDLKNPSEGALGALPCPAVREIAGMVNGQKMLSATIGDLPMEPALLVDAVRNMADTGVNIVKIGFFPSDDMAGCINALTPLARKGTKLVAVFFADMELPGPGLFFQLGKAGFYGVMLDTADKNGKHLLDHLSDVEIGQFLQDTKMHQLKSGLAGSLDASHIPVILPFAPDYLGFRTALCANASRLGNLDKNKLIEFKELLHKCNTMFQNQVKYC